MTMENKRNSKVTVELKLMLVCGSASMCLTCTSGVLWIQVSLSKGSGQVVFSLDFEPKIFMYVI